MLGSLLELVPDALLVVDRRGAIVRANAHAERLFRYPPGALDGLDVESLMPAAMRNRHRRHRDAYVGHPRVRPMGGTRMSLVGLRRDGSQFPVEISLGPLDDGPRTRILASVRDISESQRARQALVRAGYDALLARIAHLALSHYDDDIVVQRLPYALADALEARVVAIALGDRVDDLRVVAAHGIEPAVLQASLRRSRAPSLARALLGSDVTVLDDLSGARDGSHGNTGMPGEGLAMPMADRGIALGLLLVLDPEAARFDHDARHLLRMAADLQAALILHRRTQDHLAHARRREALGQLTGGIAHDFNNLLTVAGAHMEALESEHALDESAQREIAQARRALARGAELASKLLSFARQQQLAPSVVAPHEVLTAVSSLLSRTLGRGTRLRVACDARVADVRVDPAMLETALVNLAFNARDAMPGGGEITLSAHPAEPPEGTDPAPPGGYVAIGVADTGEGMDPATLARAVEPYFSTKVDGTGLGLSMVYGFAKQSGGQLRIASRPGHGTRVDLLLPGIEAPPAR